MNKQPKETDPTMLRRQFMRRVSLAGAAVGIGPIPGLAAADSPAPADEGVPGRLCLWSDKPALKWMTEAYPLGNGPIGAMLFGGTDVERIQFNEISLWSGSRMAGDGPPLGIGDADGQRMGAYQAFGDIFIRLGHDFSKANNYRRELDIERAVHQVTYEYNGIGYQRTALASHPDGVIVIHLSADRPGAHSGRIQLADMHQAKISAAGNKLISTGKVGNGFEYEAQLLVLNQGGKASAENNGGAAMKNYWEIPTPDARLVFEGCDSLTIILTAGTNYL